MAKRLLLIDDEELFLESLKEGLSSLDHMFGTDICYTVDDAIMKIGANRFDLIITDMRMPGKSGLDLIIYLREIKFPGKIMVMSAFNSDENTRYMHSYGVIDVISKPFNLEWMKNKLVNFFSEEEKGAPNQVMFESIDLVTVMQIVNMERKTSALEIRMNCGTGVIYFEKGEIIHAQFQDLEGERAVMRLIALNQGSISIKAEKVTIRRTMEIPFVEQMVKIMQTIDELRRDHELRTGSIPQPAPVEEPTGTTKKENHTKMKEILNILKEVKGYLGAGIFTPQGEMLEGSADISGIQFEEAGSLIHDTLKDASDMSSEIGFGTLDMIQLYTQVGIILAKRYKDDTRHFHTIMVIKNDGNVAMARIKLNKVVEMLIPEF